MTTTDRLSQPDQTPASPRLTGLEKRQEREAPQLFFAPFLAQEENFCRRCTKGPAKFHHLQPDFTPRKSHASRAAPREKGREGNTSATTTAAAPRRRSPVRRGGATARSGCGAGAIKTGVNETPARSTPPRRAIARQCAGAAQRLAQACRWRDNNRRERNTSTPHTAAPRRRSPVRRGGATARSGGALA